MTPLEEPSNSEPISVKSRWLTGMTAGLERPANESESGILATYHRVGFRVLKRAAVPREPNPDNGGEAA